MPQDATRGRNHLWRMDALAMTQQSMYEPSRALLEGCDISSMTVHDA